MDRELQAYAMGQPFPDNVAAIDGVTFSHDVYGGLRALVVLSDPRPDELHAFHHARWRFTLARDEGMPLVVIELDAGLAGESPLTLITPYADAVTAEGADLVGSAQRLASGGGHALVGAVLVEMPSTHVVGLRAFTLGQSFTRELGRALVDAYRQEPMLPADLMGAMARHAERWPNVVKFARKAGVHYCWAGD